MSKNVDHPKISIITICFNSEKTIEQTIQSVALQSYDNIEYLIIDGASTDHTVQVINQYLSFIDFFVSEPDAGIYDAMNKGIKHATGEWIYFLNSGDRIFSKNTLENIFSKPNKKINGDVSILIGDVLYDSSKHFKGYMNSMIMIRNTLHHQGTIYRYTVFEKILYDNNLKILGDYDVNLYLYKKKAKYINLKEILAKCENGGVSMQVMWSKYIEEIKIKRKYFCSIVAYFLSIIVFIKYVLKKIFLFIGDKSWALGRS